ncbi:MAG: HpaII family restriction endonuclease [Ruminococcus sp.]|nr:HpaII family restriction endonuclease [Ruminococcus sp.]
MTGNIGEWSELYTMLKLLADGRLYAADANTNKLPDIYYDVLKIIRETRNNKLEYRRDSEIKVVDATTGKIICNVPISNFIDQTYILLQNIYQKKVERTKGAFEIPESWRFAQSIKCETLKARSQDKSDIVLMVHDIMSGRDDIFGFSIKSQLGSPSTLLNASGATNFTYKLVGHKLSNDEILIFEGFKKFSDKFIFLNSIGTDIIFDSIDNKTLEFNLKMVTSEMPTIFAKMIENYYKGGLYRICDLVDNIANSSTIINTMDNSVYLINNVKDLLTNIALGMVPNTLWTGDYEATGGYIIVKDDGDVVCYHIYNRNAFRNYIFLNTRLDTPSKTRHGFGTIYEENDEQFLKLNVQIRFIK